ncbi:hypothetical protein LSM04_008784 [Trypanosoma melophagium]|uniref:uncharacterized protein n=1 Tax=Trypanosoma melophagium TaxID=715481 RepID=UPI00351A7732|nr:hypothetical protein LSM04_007177 [Trypanosoma melophagium]KAH9582271.1 hypothetical protein LSM04_008784 [Trypanosoma melophagium]
MEAVVYEDIPDVTVRLERLKVSLLAFIGVPAVVPSVVAIIVPVSFGVGNASSSDVCATYRVREVAAARLRQACTDRAQLRRWLRHEFEGAMDLWVVAAIDPRDTSELSTLANWQINRHRSPLAQADAISLSMREVALLWGEKQRVPLLERFLLPHQSLFLDMTCCFGEGSHQPVDPAVFGALHAKHVAKGRTSIILFYGVWLSLSATPRGLARLQQQFRSFARNVLSPTQLPFCCTYGGSVGVLQQNLVSVPSPGRKSHEGCLHPLASAALLVTRSLKDVYSLAAVLFGNPQVNYYGEAAAFCASVQRRRRAASLVYNTCVPSETSTAVATHEGATGNASRAQRRKRGREAVALVRSTSDEEVGEELSWCEDVGN